MQPPPSDLEAALRAVYWKRYQQRLTKKISAAITEQGYWQALQQKQMTIPDVLQAIEDQFPRLAKRVLRREAMRLRREHRRPSVISREESARADIVSLLVWSSARRHCGAPAGPSVLEVARHLLQGHLFSTDDVGVFYGSAAPYYLTPEDFSRRNMPVHDGPWVVDSESHTAISGRRWRLSVKLRHQHSRRRAGIRVTREYRATSEADIALIPVPASPGLPQIRRAYPGSLAFQLWNLAGQLVHYLPWQRVQALAFLLTEQVPFVAPLTVERAERRNPEYRRLEITVRADAWVSEASVRRAYRATQQELEMPRVRPLGERKLALLSWWFRETAAAPRTSFQLMMNRWNKATATPSWRYQSYRRFQQDVLKGIWQIRFPGRPVPSKGLQELPVLTVGIEPTSRKRGAR